MVTEHETTSFAGMGMEVYVHLQAVVLDGLLNYYFPGRPDRWLFDFAWIKVPSVQVDSHRIETVVASGDTIRIKNWNYFENEVLT